MVSPTNMEDSPQPKIDDLPKKGRPGVKCASNQYNSVGVRIFQSLLLRRRSPMDRVIFASPWWNFNTRTLGFLCWHSKNGSSTSLAVPHLVQQGKGSLPMPQHFAREWPTFLMFNLYKWKTMRKSPIQTSSTLSITNTFPSFALQPLDSLVPHQDNQATQLSTKHC